MNSATIGSSPLSEMAFPRSDLGVDAGYREGAAFVVADEVPAALIRRYLRKAQSPEMR